jgi:hypothetical protein
MISLFSLKDSFAIAPERSVLALAPHVMIDLSSIELSSIQMDGRFLGGHSGYNLYQFAIYKQLPYSVLIKGANVSWNNDYRTKIHLGDPHIITLGIKHALLDCYSMQKETHYFFSGKVSIFRDPGKIIPDSYPWRRIAEKMRVVSSRSIQNPPSNPLIEIQLPDSNRPDRQYLYGIAFLHLATQKIAQGTCILTLDYLSHDSSTREFRELEMDLALKGLRLLLCAAKNGHKEARGLLGSIPPNSADKCLTSESFTTLVGSVMDSSSTYRCHLPANYASILSLVISQVKQTLNVRKKIINETLEIFLPEVLKQLSMQYTSEENLLIYLDAFKIEANKTYI